MTRQFELRRLLFALLSLTALDMMVGAQTLRPWAKVSRAVGDAQLAPSLQSTHIPLKSGQYLSNGDAILTGPGSQVVISLWDESKVIVFPNSHVIIKDFDSAPTARNLLKIISGRILVKIRHYGSKPNPYRLSSPAASIAVRGTEFVVDVKVTGETLVAVTDGLVEVSAIADSSDSRLVRRGESVIVRLGARIGLAAPGDLNGESRAATSGGGPSRSLSAAYQRSVDAAAQTSLETQPIQFSAFPDAHIDSLENPAYMSDFRQAQGRLFLLPSISRAERMRSPVKAHPAVGDDFPYRGEPHRFDYSVTPQISFFTPISDTRFTIGGAVTAMRTSLEALTLYQSAEDALARILSVSEFDGGAVQVTAINSSIGAARRFGDGRTSVGLQVETLSSDGAFLNVRRSYEALASGGVAIESKAEIDRTRITLGFSREFSGGKKFGAYYRYGLTSVNQDNQLRSQRNDLSPYDHSHVATRSREIGLRWRSPLTRRLYYGLEGSYLNETIESRYQTSAQRFALEGDVAKRGRFGGGLGIAAPGNTLFALDWMGGFFTTTKPTAEGPVNLIRFREERGHFLSAHAAVQTDLGRKAFTSASFLLTARESRFLLYPMLVSLPALQSLEGAPLRQSYTWKLTNLGAGWKFKPTMISEYIFTMDHNRRSHSHSLLFRYTFDVNIFGER